MELISTVTMYCCMCASVPEVPLPAGYYSIAFVTACQQSTAKMYWETMPPNSLIHMGTRTYKLNVDGTMSPFRGF